ncbi:MAG: hypothetical protein AB8Y83_02275 [Coxiella endosymbiont of Haemaphysalis qinghaiensis]
MIRVTAFVGYGKRNLMQPLNWVKSIIFRRERASYEITTVVVIGMGNRYKL